MHFDWTSLIGIGVGVVGYLIHQAIKTPRDSERAMLLATLADDAAAVIVNLTPGATWAQMVRDIVAKLAATASVPTANAGVLEQAATAALVRLGKLTPVLAPRR